MADELTVNISVAYEDSEGTQVMMEALNQIIDVTTKRVIHIKHNVGTTEEAMDLGDISSLGAICVRNRDGTNFVQVRASTGGTAIVKALAGECWAWRCGSGVTAPFIIADTAACQVEYLIVSA